MTDFLALHSLTVDPETSPVADPLTLSLDFSVLQDIAGPVTWTLTYVLDSSGALKSLVLYTSPEPQVYAQGEKHTLTIKTPEIDLSQVKRQVLLNVGIIRLEARSLNGDEAVVAVNMVTHVSRDKEDESKLNKTVLNPFD
jgi:hypothetical protein